MEKTIRLPEGLFDLLQEVIRKRRPDLAHYLTTPGSITVNKRIAEKIQGTVMEEFVDTGLRDDDEPNAHGYQLEDIADRVSPTLFDE